MPTPITLSAGLFRPSSDAESYESDDSYASCLFLCFAAEVRNMRSCTVSEPHASGAPRVRRFRESNVSALAKGKAQTFFCVSFGSEGIPHGAYGQKSLNTTAKVDGVCRWLARAPSSQGLADHVGSCEGTLRFIIVFIHDGSIANSKIRFCHRSTRAHNAESSCQRPLTTSDMVSQALGTWSPRKLTANAVNFLGGV